jgi:hypothetical protein
LLKLCPFVCTQFYVYMFAHVVQYTNMEQNWEV